MPCLTGMKSVILQGLLWMYLLEFGFIVESLEPGYLDFDNLPDTNFSCVGKVIGGYYADLETSCQMFHVCTIGQLDEPMDIRFLCLNGTVFDQETRVCERIDEVDCSKSEKFYHLNLELYGNTQPPILEESPETDPPLPQVKSTSTTTTTSTPKPSFYTTSQPLTTSRSKTISSHHFPVDSSPDIRFNPEEINISLHPESAPTIRTKPISFQQQSFSEDRNKHIIVTHASGYAAERKQPDAKLPVDTPKISVTTDQPKVGYSVSTPSEINGEFGYQNTEAIVNYDTELPPHNYQYHASVPHFQPTAAEIHPYSELFKSSTYRTLYHTTSTPLKLYHSRATTLRTQNIPKPPPYHYQRTEKATRLPQPLPLYSTLRPLTFSSPAPFSSKRHIDSKRNADHQVPRIIISSSASGTVVDPTGRILNYSIGDTHMLGRTPPASYDDYKEDDISLDPFYRDVPKLKAKEQEAKRQKRSTKESEPALKNEEEETDALKFLLNWYSSYEQTTKIPIPLPSAAITEINNELSSSAANEANSTDYDYDEYGAVISNTTEADVIFQNVSETSGNHLNLKELVPKEIWDEANNNGTDVENDDDVEYDYADEYDDYNNDALNTTNKDAREKEKDERYLQYMKLNERISRIFSNDYVDYSGKPLAYLEAFAKSDDKANYLSTDSPEGKSQDSISEKGDRKTDTIDGVIENPLNNTKDNQTEEITKTLEGDDYIDDNYEAQLYEQSSKATPEQLKVIGVEENKAKYDDEDEFKEAFLETDHREDRSYVSTTHAEVSLTTSTENTQSAKEDYVNDDYEDQNHPPNSELPPIDDYTNVNKENESKIDDHQNDENLDLITTESVKLDNANDEFLDSVTQAEITTTNKIPENLSFDKVEYSSSSYEEATPVEQTTTTETSKLGVDYIAENIEEPLLNTEPPKIEEVTAEKSQVTTDIPPTSVTISVDAKEDATSTQKPESSSQKHEAFLHRTVTRGRTNFRQNLGRVNPTTNFKLRTDSRVYNKFKNHYTTSKHDVTNTELKKSNDEQVAIQNINLDQDALRKMAEQAFSLHKKQEATTENIESVISKAISRSKGRFGLAERKNAEAPREDKVPSTFPSFTQVFVDTTELAEEIFTTNTDFTDATATSALSSLSTESYTTTSTSEAIESYTIPSIITTELPTTYLQKIIENIETTTKSIATSISLPEITISLANTSETESNYFGENAALLTSTEIPTTEASNEVTSTPRPIHTTSRKISSRGRPFQYNRRTTTRRGNPHRFDLQNRRRYDRRKPHSEINESSTEKPPSKNSNFNSVNNKSSVAPNNLNSSGQQETITISVLNAKTDSLVENEKINLEENVDRKEENVTDPSFSKSANPTLAKESKDELSTTPISRFIRIKVRKEKMHKSYVFNCFGKKVHQYYSDPRDCRLFHYCTPGFTKTQLLDMKFVCDLGTYFDDGKLTCTKDKPARCR